MFEKLQTGEKIHDVPRIGSTIPELHNQKQVIIENVQ